MDDDVGLQGRTIDGLPVSSPTDIKNLIKKFDIKLILLATRHIGKVERNYLLDLVGDTKISVRMVPSVNELASGNISVSDIRSLQIEDLLVRDPISPDITLLQKTISKKNVVVTGAGGSIGAELCTQITKLNPNKFLPRPPRQFWA